MTKKIPYGTRQLISKLYAQGLPKAKIARLADVSLSTVYVYSGEQKSGSSDISYQLSLAIKNGFGTVKEYKDHLAKKGGYGSYNEYLIHLEELRQNRQLNQKLSYVIKKRLKELDKPQKWLARKIGITPSSVSKYVTGKTVPRMDNQNKLFQALGVPYQTLDDLVNDLC